MSELTSFLKDASTVFLATVGLDEGAKVRPFAYLLEEDGKIWWTTKNMKEVHQELNSGKAVEFCALSKTFEWVRYSGVPVFEDNKHIKEQAFVASPMLKGQYPLGADDPSLALFYLTKEKATLYGYGKEPRQLL